MKWITPHSENVFSLFNYVYLIMDMHMCIGTHEGQKRASVASGAGVTGICEDAQHGCRKLILCPQQKQHVLFNTELSLSLSQPCV